MPNRRDQDVESSGCVARVSRDTNVASAWVTFRAATRRAKPPRRDGSGVLPSGAVRPEVALFVARVLLAVSLALSVVLAQSARDEPLILPLCLLIIALAWSYSAPPLRLLARGLGEATTALVVTLLTPLLGYYVQRGFF
jgi:1,4-dihydroxy-2-naphthoate octaprenyltransferase